MTEQLPTPLAGKRVVITRAESQSAPLAHALRANGAQVISLPLIQIAPPEDFSPLDYALHKLFDFDWIIFTSQNAVAATMERMQSLKLNMGLAPDSFRIAAVGNSTAEMLRSLGFSVDYTGKGGTAAALITEITTELRGKKIFLPRSDRASAALVTQLKSVGADVTEVIAYRTLAIESIDLRNKRACGEADAILFFSSSGVQSFHALLRSGQLAHPKENVAIGAIGPVTLSELQVVGMPCHFQAREPALTEIVAALAKYFARHTMHSSSGVTAS